VSEGRPFRELRTTGLLWLINATTFHPRGYALALHLDENGDVTGWSILGDGSEPWYFSTAELTEAERAGGCMTLNESLAAVKRELP
jgi:hypothetical protein